MASYAVCSQLLRFGDLLNRGKPPNIGQISVVKDNVKQRGMNL
jgi:hypothetical protein